MPDNLVLTYRVRMIIQGLPPHLRDAANLLVVSLLTDPVPPDAKPFLGEWPGPDMYQLSTDLITVYYTVSANDVVIGLIHPNS